MVSDQVQTGKMGFIDRFFPDRTLGALGGLTFLTVLTVYVMTVAPTVSFWDCGEFIACSYTLGIPHPPGSPLYVLIGRLFSILPTATDISLRVNLFSSVSLTFAATVAFFVLARIITWWYSDRYPNPNLPLGSRLAVYAGSLSGALFFAFASTNWANAVEAEVYGLAMFLMMVLIWLALIWIPKRDEPGSDRYLIAMSYLALLSVSVHLTTFFIVFPLFLMVMMLSRRLRTDWRFWVTGVTLSMVMIGVVDFLVAATVWVALTGLMTLTAGREKRWSWGFPFAMTLVALLAFTAHAYIPIRSQHNPGIDQNNPETWVAFRAFLERKQYGEQSMFQRALARRGEWSNQFGQHRRMGFWGFFDRQYGFNDTYFIPLFLVGLLGFGELIRRRRAIGAFLLLAFALSSVGLVWYMNFADGTRFNANTQDAYLEVRDRDYFYTPAFILFGLAIGLGGATIVRWLGSRGVMPIIGAIVVSALPIRTILANYELNDRSRNYIPYDYAHNILASADKDAILFTNGDNDTFPVWCLQEVYGIRRDVRVANLSLMNTHWYIRQLRNRMNVPMDLSEAQIDRLVHFRDESGKISRIQDQMIDHILTANRWEQPINFAVTVSGANRHYKGRPLDGHLKMIGLAYRLCREEGRNMVELETMERLLGDEMQFRGLNDPTVYKDENTHRLVANYISTFLVLADTLRLAGDYAGAERYARLGLEVLPNAPDAYTYLAQLFVDSRQTAKLDTLWSDVLNSYANNRNLDQVATSVALSYRRLDDTVTAVEILRGVLDRSPDNEAAFRPLVQMYYELKQYDTLLQFMESWVAQNPADERSKQLLSQVRGLTERLKEPTEPASDDTAGTTIPGDEG